MTPKHYELCEQINNAQRRYRDAIDYIRRAKTFRAEHTGAMQLIAAHNDLVKLFNKLKRYYGK